MQSGTFTSNSPFDIRLPSFGTHTKAQARRRAAARAAKKSGARPGLLFRMAHFVGDAFTAWATAGADISQRR